MHTMIKKALVAASIALFTTQAFSALDKQPSEDQSINVSGIIVGEITDITLNRPEGIAGAINLTYDTKSHTFRFDNSVLSSTFGALQSTLPQKKVVSYVQHNLVGDIKQLRVPSIKSTNNEVTRLHNQVPFSSSSSRDYADKILQDNNINVERVKATTGAISSVIRQRVNRVEPALRICNVTIIDEQTGEATIVSTETEELCQFAENAVIAQEKVAINYVPTYFSQQITHPAIVSIRVASTPENAPIVGHNDESVTVVPVIDDSDPNIIGRAVGVAEEALSEVWSRTKSTPGRLGSIAYTIASDVASVPSGVYDVLTYAFGGLNPFGRGTEEEQGELPPDPITPPAESPQTSTVKSPSKKAPVDASPKASAKVVESKKTTKGNSHSPKSKAQKHRGWNAN